MRIFQLVAGFSRGDAISKAALLLRRVFRSWGCPSEIACDGKAILADLREEAWTLERCAAEAGPGDLVLLHLAIGSPANALFAELPARKAILYHNITPPEFFAGLEQTRLLEEGRRQAAQLAGAAEVALAVSRFNAADLEQMGYRDVRVFPFPMDLDELRAPPNRATLAKYGDGLVNVLFVGRCVPNKRIEDVLASFYYFQRYVEPRSRLIHVGSYAGTEQYHAMLLACAHDLALENADMIGAVPQDELNAVYRCADVFLCMSEHEGFCTPLIECMLHDVPILAYAAGAVPETLDGAGILFREKNHDAVAEMMGRLVGDEPFRAAVLNGQRERLKRYAGRDLSGELRGHLASLLAAGSTARG